MNLFINETVGSVKSILLESKEPEYVIVLAHGAGAGMKHPFLEALAQALSSNAHVIRFNFPYMDAGKKVPGSPKVAQEALLAAAETGRKLYPTLPVFISGKSYGGRMASHLALETNFKMAGLIYFGFPLHAPGKDSAVRAEHLKELGQPQYFVQGSKDKLANFQLIQKLIPTLKHADLVEIKNGDHSFKIPKKEGGDIDKTIDFIAAKTHKWAMKVLK